MSERETVIVKMKSNVIGNEIQPLSLEDAEQLLNLEESVFLMITPLFDEVLHFNLG